MNEIISFMNKIMKEYCNKSQRRTCKFECVIIKMGIQKLYKLNNNKNIYFGANPAFKLGYMV